MKLNLSLGILQMDHENIKIENINKLFEFERLSRDIDSIDDNDQLKNLLKYFIKLYLKQQEVLIEL